MRPVTRRTFLGCAASAPVVLIATPVLADACYDPAALPFNQKSRRRSIAYLEVSGDPQRRCQGCAFFTAGATGCGTCTLLAGPVNAGATCSSFARKG
jgi:hypothetical protein